MSNEEFQTKVLDYLTVLTYSVMCPSWHGTVKYNKVTQALSKLKREVENKQ